LVVAASGPGGRPASDARRSASAVGPAHKAARRPAARPQPAYAGAGREYF
jgi:hypothetical protein